MVKTANETVVPLKTNKTNKSKKTVAAAAVISRATRRSTRITKRPERYSPVPSGSGRFSDDYGSSEHDTNHSWSDATSINTANSISSACSQSKQNGGFGLANAVSTAFENMDLESQGSNSMASFLSASNEHSATNSSSSYNPSNSGNSDGSSTYNEIESTADS